MTRWHPAPRNAGQRRILNLTFVSTYPPPTEEPG